MRTALLTLALLASTGCSSTYYGLMEMVGKEKRDILVSRVEDAREEQVDAQEQFKTTLERLREITGSDGGELEAAYKSFSGEYDDSVDAAEDVRSRIKKVKDVAEDMFAEWEAELDEFTSDEYRRDSEKALRDSRARYDAMMDSMDAAAASMDPVLDAFKDQTLRLKHSLNASALSELEGEVLEIESTVGELIARMEESIAKADSYIKGLE